MKRHLRLFIPRQEFTRRVTSYINSCITKTPLLFFPPPTTPSQSGCGSWNDRPSMVSHSGAASAPQLGDSPPCRPSASSMRTSAWYFDSWEGGFAKCQEQTSHGRRKAYYNRIDQEVAERRGRWRLSPQLIGSCLVVRSFVVVSFVDYNRAA